MLWKLKRILVCLFLLHILFSEDVILNAISASYTEDSMENVASEYLTDSYKNVYEYIFTVERVHNRGLNMIVDQNKMYRMTDTNTEQPYRILQLTDVHLTGSDDNYKKDILAIDTVYQLIKRTSPDFIVITGDLIYGRSDMTSDEGLRAMDVLSRLMDRIGIVWTWTFGNHDHDFFDQFSAEKTEQILAQSKTLRMYPKQDQITGYTNGVFQLCDHNKLVMAVILLDSNDMIYDDIGLKYEYDYIHSDQTEWYEGKLQDLHDIFNQVPVNMLFFHIPLKEYETAWDLCQSGDEQAEYLFGDKKESVCASIHDSLLFQKAVDLGSTRAMFCGHDHTNNYGVIYKGIKLIYSKSIDYVAYTGIDQQKEQRGATLITIDKNSNYMIDQIQFE